MSAKLSKSDELIVACTRAHDEEDEVFDTLHPACKNMIVHGRALIAAQKLKLISTDLSKRLRECTPNDAIELEAADEIDALTETALVAERGKVIEECARYHDEQARVNHEIAEEEAQGGDPLMADIHTQMAEQHERDAAAIRALADKTEKN